MPVWMWSHILSAIGITGWILIGRKKASGFVVSLIGQVVWIAYAVTTEQVGFIWGSLAYGTAQAYGLWRWIKEKKTANELS